MVSDTTERSAASRQLGQQQIITNVGSYSKAAEGEKIPGLEIIGNNTRVVKKKSEKKKKSPKHLYL